MAQGKESACKSSRPSRFDPWVGKIPWRRKWQPTPVFLPGESHGQKSMVGYSPRGCKESTRLRDLTFTSKYGAYHSLLISIQCRSVGQLRNPKWIVYCVQYSKIQNPMLHWLLVGEKGDSFSLTSRGIEHYDSVCRVPQNLMSGLWILLSLTSLPCWWWYNNTKVRAIESGLSPYNQLSIFYHWKLSVS